MRCVSAFVLDREQRTGSWRPRQGPASPGVWILILWLAGNLHYGVLYGRAALGGYWAPRIHSQLSPVHARCDVGLRMISCVLISCASAKTALALAFCLRMRDMRRLRLPSRCLFTLNEWWSNPSVWRYVFGLTSKDPAYSFEAMAAD